MISNNTKFDFDDLLIVPSVITNINSRYSDIYLPHKLPLITAPMDTVVDLSNIDDYINNNIHVCLPRTINYNDFKKIYNHRKYTNVFISLGFREIENELHLHNFQSFHNNAHILIDVANGHMSKIIEYAKKIKQLRPDIIIMVGNIANPETYLYYANSQCVDYIRIGIGNGGGCLTTKHSGVGYPMASLINETYQIKKQFVKDNLNIKAPFIVADGGMKNYSDIIKALALGADFVMIGSIFNKTIESCADNYFWGFKVNKRLAKFLFSFGFPIVKYFRGMSTKDAQKAMGSVNLKTSEGVIRFRKVEYSLYGWTENFKHYLRTSMSYVGAKSLQSFIEFANFIIITNKSYDRFNK